MKNRWVQFGCFLTGYKYEILKGCSEVSHRAVKRYTAALVIVCILWAFIGYSFVNKYLKADGYFSMVGAVLFVLIILQVERQIILSDSKQTAKYWIRGFIAFIMAIIGSIIIDQIIFREDIKHKELFELNAQVDSIMPAKETELKRQSVEIDSSIHRKEAERENLLNELSRNPFIQVVNRQNDAIPISNTVIDSNKNAITKTSLVRKTAYIVSSVQNPKMSMLGAIDQQIKDLQAIKVTQENRIVKLRDEVERDVKANSGFLYELKLMFHILLDSYPALFVWLMWFLLLLGIEIFIMVNKIAHTETDYDVSIQHHMELQKRKLRLLAIQISARE
ncbi:MAG: DUF4407 domain-containing protein [Mucilaginibacter sp.]